MLDYLFIAETFNHNFIKQTQEDVSRTDPKKSSFTDVLKEKIRRFSLVGKGHIISVDLVDGHAERDGKVISPPRFPLGDAKLNLVYYRQVQQRLGVSSTTSKPLSPLVRYFIGWKTKVMGKDINLELGID